MLACTGGYSSLVLSLLRKLIKFDLDVDLRDNLGYTSLLLAIKKEHYDISHDLIKYANACTTLHDNEFHLNAEEWLKANLEERKKKRVSHTTYRRRNQSPGKLKRVIAEKQVIEEELVTETNILEINIQNTDR